ncbi:MAG: hypothetical protein ACREQ5_28850, partial [Candidatus Dormibacteria bacterium]
LSFSFAQTSSTITSPLLFFKTTKDAYTYNPATLLVTKVSNANYPATTVPGVVYLDATFYVADPQGRVWGSNFNDPLSWTALNEIAAQSEPDGGAAIAKLYNYVLFFGLWSTTLFYDATIAAPASPLLPNATITSLLGCASGDSVVEMQESVVWIGQTKKEGRGIYIYEGLQVQKISTPFVDRILQADTLASVRAFATELSGHFSYVLTLVNSNITLTYDFVMQNWQLWTSTTVASPFVIQSLSSDSYGKVFAIANSHGMQDGDPLTVTGASTLDYNGSFNIQLIDANSFYYFIPTAPLPNSGVAQGVSVSEGYFIGVSSAQLSGSDYVQDQSSGAVYLLSPTSYNDSGSPINMLVVTDNFDNSTRQFKEIVDCDLLCDNVNSRGLLRYTNDDFKT